MSRLLKLLGLLAAASSLACDTKSTKTIGVPTTPIRVVSYNVFRSGRGVDGLIRTINELKPDLVTFAEVPEADVQTIAAGVHLPNVAYETTDGGDHPWGVAILSRYPLEKASAIPPHPGGGVKAVWAWCVVDGKRFRVAAVHLSATFQLDPRKIAESFEWRAGEIRDVINAWKADGSPPMIVAGDFNQPPMGDNYAAMTRDFGDVLKSLKIEDNTFGDGLLRTRIDYILKTPAWTAKTGGLGAAGASDHRPIWAELSGR